VASHRRRIVPRHSGPLEFAKQCKTLKVPARTEDTRTRIMDVSQRLIQARGFAAFSYADIATELGIRKASVHHHFATKSDLAVELMKRYRVVFAAALEDISDTRMTCRRRLVAYKELFANVLRDDHRLCMCGMLAADFEALTAEVRNEVRGFFDDNELWLANVLGEGKRKKETSFRGTPKAQARVVLSALEGAMLVARTYRDLTRFETVANDILARVTPS
jgi:TetR/AcrR family transcriptional regulator, transcriptional repressor for nem operon